MPVTSAAQNTSPTKILLDLGVDMDSISTDEEYLKALMNTINSLDPGDGRIEILQKEVIRVRNNLKKQKALSFVNGKTAQKTEQIGSNKKQTKVGGPKVGVVGRTPSQESPEDLTPKDFEGRGEEKAEQASNDVEKLKTILVPGFTKIEGHLQSILKTFKDQSTLGEKQDRKDDIREEKFRKKDRESELEGKGSKPKVLEVAEKAIKPAKGLFGIILGFVKNILMGIAMVGLVNILQNIGKIKKMVVGVVNGIIGFLNFVLKVLFGTILMPFNALIKGFNFGFKLIFGAINAVLKLFKQKPLTAWKIPELKPPQIPTIPVPAEPKDESAPVQKAEGGGEVEPNVTENVTNETTNTNNEEQNIANVTTNIEETNLETGDEDVENEVSDTTSEIDTNIINREAELGNQIIKTETLINEVPDEQGAPSSETPLPPEPPTEDEGETPSESPTEAQIEDSPEVKDQTVLKSPDNVYKGESMLGAPEKEPLPEKPPTPVGEDKGVVEGVQSAMGGGVVQKMKRGGVVQKKGGGKTVSADKISASEGGPVKPNSGVTVTGMGPDTQLVAAQPGEIVMSKKAVDKIGADKLLAMNKDAGGTNKPIVDTAEGVKVSRMKGGGMTFDGEAISRGIVDKVDKARSYLMNLGKNSPRSRNIGTPSKSKTNVRVIPIVPKQSPQGASSSGASADQKQVNSFNASDVNNFDLNVVKSIYNIVG